MEKSEPVLRARVSEKMKCEFSIFAKEFKMTESELLRHIVVNFIAEQKKIKLAEQLKEIEGEEK